MSRAGYLTLATGRVWFISYLLRLSHMGSDVGKIFLRRRAGIGITQSYALVCEKELSHMGKNNRNPNLVCEQILFIYSQIENS